MTPLLGRIYPKGVAGRQGHFTRQVAQYWHYSMALKPPFSSLYYCSLVIQGLGPSHGVAPSMVFPTHGYRGAALWSPCPCVIPSWRRPISATPYLGDAFSWRGLYLASPPPRRRLTLTLTLTLSTPGYGTVQIGRCMYNRMWLVV